MHRRVLYLLILLMPLAAVDGAQKKKATDGDSVEVDATTPKQVFEQMQRSFRSDKAKGQHLWYQFNFSDPQGGNWWIQINDGAYAMGLGMAPHADVTFVCSGADWVKLSNGTLSGFKAVLTGRLHVNGNQFDARKLDEIFP